MRMTLNDIGKALRKVLSAVARAAWGITLCAGGLAVGIAGEILLGVLNFMFGILTALLSIVTIIWTFIWLLTLEFIRIWRKETARRQRSNAGFTRWTTSLSIWWKRTLTAISALSENCTRSCARMQEGTSLTSF